MISTPRLAPFSLEEPAIAPSTALGFLDPDRVRDEMLELEIGHLMRQARLWRVVNSAQWIAWGIVQAKVPGMEEELGTKATDAVTSTSTADQMTGSTVEDVASPEAGANLNGHTERSEESLAPEHENEEGSVHEFDYLAYAQDRALFFWSDLLSLGRIQESDLPTEILETVKSRMLFY
jgi:choline kinase